MLAGSAAGLAGSLYSCPLDVVKTRLQNKSRTGPCSHGLGTLPTLACLWREEGLRGLYRGLGPTLVGYLPSWAIYFTVYQWAKQELARHDPARLSHSPLVHVVSAISAACVSTTCTNPLWVVRTRLMLQSASSLYHYRGTIDGLRQLWHQEGLRGWYKGIHPSLLGTLHVGIQFPLYEWLKVQLAASPGSFDLRTVLCASVISKAVASLASYPHEVIRTRLHHQSMEQVQIYRGVLHTFFKILREEGPRGFYLGLSTNMIKVIPASALTFLTYEYVSATLDVWTANKR